MNKTPRRPRPLDRTDRLILKYLQEDGRLSNVALARKVNLTPTPLGCTGIKDADRASRRT